MKEQINLINAELGISKSNLRNMHKTNIQQFNELLKIAEKSTQTNEKVQPMKEQKKAGLFGRITMIVKKKAVAAVQWVASKAGFIKKVVIGAVVATAAYVMKGSKLFSKLKDVAVLKKAGGVISKAKSVVVASGTKAMAFVKSMGAKAMSIVTSAAQFVWGKAIAVKDFVKDLAVKAYSKIKGLFVANTPPVAQAA